MRNSRSKLRRRSSRESRSPTNSIQRRKAASFVQYQPKLDIEYDLAGATPETLAAVLLDNGKPRLGPESSPLSETTSNTTFPPG